jgi:hypothetical protein
VTRRQRGLKFTAGVSDLESGAALEHELGAAGRVNIVVIAPQVRRWPAR